ncbi:hypothetical protein D3C86_690170 [compost metagenome]
MLDAGQAHLRELVGHDLPDLALGLLGMAPQGEGHVLADVHRVEQGAVLEEHAELLADLVELPLLEAGDILAVHVNRTLIGLQEADQELDEDRLPGARGPDDDGGLAPLDVQGDVVEHLLAPEGLVHVLERDDRVRDYEVRHSITTSLPTGSS